MGQSIPQQHPAVVLRSHYELVRALLALAAVTVVCLAVAVAIVVADDNGSPSTSAVGRAQPAGVQASHLPAATALLRSSHGFTRFDGGPEEGTRGAIATASPTTRFDGGPEEGTRGAIATASPFTRFDGGPEEGTAGR
ncbi:hypothetical protein [Capillimicrobium parvum]|uniref:Uncharacterized protein n=1 Tax=Capillimicrobium parvum TaxID=2884022 RepID=A0A9E6XYX9_9ACTN|nr:hypothetical protein [Capillimicrobium parvum]UGS37044.1 hypothetical protein DSM104329_03456 [Capillimicrobium parvum]